MTNKKERKVRTSESIDSNLPLDSGPEKEIIYHPGIDGKTQEQIKNDRGIVGSLRSPIARKLSLPSSGVEISLRTYKVDPKHTWVDESINPRNQRLLLEEEGNNVKQLQADILAVGQQTPCIAREREGPNGERFEIIDGSTRRLACLNQDKLTKDIFPLLISLGDIPIDADAIALARTNEKHTQKLTPWEWATDLARRYPGFGDYRKQGSNNLVGLSTAEIAEREGLSKPAAANYARLATIPSELIFLLKNPRLLDVRGGKDLAAVIDGSYKKSSQQLSDSERLERRALVEEAINTYTKENPNGRFKNAKALGAYLQKILGESVKKEAPTKPKKYLDKSGNVFAEIKTVQKKPGEYTIKIYSNAPEDLVEAIARDIEFRAR